MNSIIAGTDLGDRESLAAVLSPMGDVADRFTFSMIFSNDQSCSLKFVLLANSFSACG